MRCPKCHSENVSVQTEQAGGQTVGIAKHSIVYKTSLFRRMARLFMILCTCGLWLLIPKKRMQHFGSTVSTSTHSFQHQTVGVCQSCGHTWKIGKARSSEPSVKHIVVIAVIVMIVIFMMMAVLSA